MDGASKVSLIVLRYRKCLVCFWRLRPEAYGAFVDRTKRGIRAFPVNDQVLNSDALNELFNKYNSYLLPQTFPEGAPLHPSYAAGHATVSAACVTLLKGKYLIVWRVDEKISTVFRKAFFDGSYVLPDPVQPDATGHTLLPYNGSPLTLEGELNKLSASIGMGRNLAGVHYLSDYVESVYLGEQVAINFLRDYKGSFNEEFEGWKFRNFEGKTVYVWKIKCL